MDAGYSYASFVFVGIRYCLARPHKLTIARLQRCETTDMPLAKSSLPTSSPTRRATIGVDVGTGSARAGVFDATGRLIASAKHAITTWHSPGNIVEQSSDQIWQAVCISVRDAVAQSGLAAKDIIGIGFDATCSLVAVTAEGAPVAVGPTGDPQRNIIVWMDHRATIEAAEINAGNHAVLAYVGGKISPEMQTPKLLWLKKNLAQSLTDAGHFFDLSDYLTWRSTGSASRSICTVTCKWTYLAHENRWDSAYFNAIGLEALVADGFARIGKDIVAPGTALGDGLTANAAAELGLLPGTAVGAALIDAHAGGVGTLGVSIADAPADETRRLAYIFGTSACAMASSTAPVFVKGVWGPYYAAMLPGLWLTEGGQSAAGAAIDHLIAMHPAAAKAGEFATAAGMSVVNWLEKRAAEHSPVPTDVVDLAKSVHVVPEFLGNRSPHADPDARAVIAGLSLDTGIDDLVGLYIAGLCGVGYGLRQLLNSLRADGIQIDTIIVSGGAAQSDLVRQLLADATAIPVAAATTPEPVLLGAAMLAANAAGLFPSLQQAMVHMSGTAVVFHPMQGRTAALHTARFQAFEALQTVARQIR